MFPTSPRSPWVRYGALVALAVLNALVPVVSSPQAVLASLTPHVGLWVAVRLLQVPVVALVALTLWPLLAGQAGRWALAGRVGVVCFALAWGIVAAAQGAGLGALVAYASAQAAAAQTVLAAAVDALWVSQLLGFLAFVGTVGWLVAVLAVASVHARSVLADSLVPLALVLGLAVGFSGLVEGQGNLPFWIGTLAVVALLAGTAQPRLPLALFGLAALLGVAGLAPGLGALAPLCLAAGLALLEARVIARVPASLVPLVEVSTAPAAAATAPRAETSGRDAAVAPSAVSKRAQLPQGRQQR